MLSGKVKWFDKKKGYGFIEKEHFNDIFFHYSAIQDEVKEVEEGQVVEFELLVGKKGLHAENIYKK